MSERCSDPLNIGGEGFQCDQEAGHPLPHMSKLAHAIWGSDDIAARERERIAAEVEKCADVANAAQRARGDVRITDNPADALANLADAHVERILRRQVELIRHGYIVVAGES